MSEAPHTPNTSAFQPEDEAKASPVRRFAPLAGVVALMGTIVVAGTALANTRTAPEIDPSAVTVEASVNAEETSERPTSTSATTTTSRAHHSDDRYDDDWDDRDDLDDLDDRDDRPAHEDVDGTHGKRLQLVAEASAAGALLASPGSVPGPVPGSGRRRCARPATCRTTDPARRWRCASTG